ncbi:hypothetical protein, variant [Exophiala oligosperma]|uniref:Uncharacterized protein n=1 Tax=Exophiala oligosperma TaxID=215243 RepID=A0A0D2EDC7_9EURO|nr:uncharacterized protein PV06_01638 [Exophiala oligosperma]XP_016266151.1 hypothetical protein, variant [Exophiala oligosperma]KIW45934.1 hypothetical protein PV06_01638 [Exophiala oligosperma]KIW45935.1 hypothetical protein, variant [Exophiala oligosperma]
MALDMDKARKVQFLQLLEIDLPEYLTCRHCARLFLWRRRIEGPQTCPCFKPFLCDPSYRLGSTDQALIEGKSAHLDLGPELVDLLLRAHEYGPLYGLPVSFLNVNQIILDRLFRTHEARLVDGQLLSATRIGGEVDLREEMCVLNSMFVNGG